MLTYLYDTTYPGPALPVVEIVVSGFAKNRPGLALRALVDSGADATIMPLRNLTTIGARKVGTSLMSGIDNLRYKVDMYEVRIRIGMFTVPKVYVIADKQNSNVIVGRDVLNHFIVTLNGLASVVEISQ